MPRLFYMIPGILTELENARTWDLQAQVYFRQRFAMEGHFIQTARTGEGYAAWLAALAAQDAAAGFNYSDGVLGATAALAAQGAKIADDWVRARRAGYQITVIAHSNGCRLALQALQLAPEIGGDREDAGEDAGGGGVRLHLLAAACDVDCRKNGLNEAAAQGQIERVTLYVSSGDEVLGLGPMLSYGELGKLGPTNLDPRLYNMLTRVDANPPCKHCDWVGRDYQQTMEAIAAAESTTALTGATETKLEDA